MKFLGKVRRRAGADRPVHRRRLLGARLLCQRQDEGPDPVTIASASLQGLKEQNRLSAFAARFVAVTTSTQSQFGLSAKKTLIMPGMVRYEVDLAKLQQKDVSWDAGTRTLGVVLPPIEVSPPQIDLTQMREYGEGGILSAFTDADSKLQDANRRAGQQELVRQAHEADADASRAGRHAPRGRAQFSRVKRG